MLLDSPKIIGGWHYFLSLKRRRYGAIFHRLTKYDMILEYEKIAVLALSIVTQLRNWFGWGLDLQLLLTMKYLAM